MLARAESLPPMDLYVETRKGKLVDDVTALQKAYNVMLAKFALLQDACYKMGMELTNIEDKLPLICIRNYLYNLNTKLQGTVWQFRRQCGVPLVLEVSEYASPSAKQYAQDLNAFFHCCFQLIRQSITLGLLLNRVLKTHCPTYSPYDDLITVRRIIPKVTLVYQEAYNRYLEVFRQITPILYT